MRGKRGETCVTKTEYFHNDEQLDAEDVIDQLTKG